MQCLIQVLIFRRLQLNLRVIGPRLQTEGAYRISPVRPSVRLCVRACVTAFLKIRTKDFSETWHEVRAP